MIDTAHYDPATRTVVSDPSIFPGLTTGGVLGIHRVHDCFAYATGWVSIGDHFNDGYLPGGTGGAFLPLPITTTEPVRVAIPIPCDRPVEVELRALDDEPIDVKTCDGIPARGELCELLGVLSDDTQPPAVSDISVQDGDPSVDPLGPLTATFSESLDPRSVTPDTCRLIGPNGPVKGRCLLSGDGRRVTFVPDIRLQFGNAYRLEISGVADTNGVALASPFAAAFTTFAPQELQRITKVSADTALDARDVAVLPGTAWSDPAAVGLTPCSTVLAVAEGDRARPDFLGGVTLYDVTDLSEAPPVLASYPTSGVDRALVAATGPPVTTTGPAAATHAGPFVMSVDDPGAPDRFGAWRLFDLATLPSSSTPPGATLTRLLNHSAESWLQFNFQDPTGSPPPDFLKFIPNDTGIPLSLANVGTEIAYVANVPNLGLQAIMPNGSSTLALPAAPQEDGALRGSLRTVSTLGDFVVAVKEMNGQSQVVILERDLSAVRDTYTLPAGGRVLGVVGLTAWPTLKASASEQIDALSAARSDLVVDAQGLYKTARGATTEPEIITEPRNLVAVLREGLGVQVVPVSDAGTIDPTLIEGGIGSIATKGKSPRGAAFDAQTQLLFVADGTAGLTIIDLAAPGGSRDDDGDGIDDRVLGTVDLGGAKAERVAVWRDLFSRSVAAVATDADGIRLVQVSAPATLHDGAAAAAVGSLAAVPADCLNIELLAPTQNQEFRIDMAGPTMPVVELQARVTPNIEGIRYQFAVGSRLRAMEYEDAYAQYQHPPRIQSEFIDEPVWQVRFAGVDAFGDVYGGHVKQVTVTLQDATGTLVSKTFDREFYILGDALLATDVDAELLQRNLDLTTQTGIMARNIARIETDYTHFDYITSAGRLLSSASRERYPMRGKYQQGDGTIVYGYGLYQLTDPVPKREQI
jgi:hypothetical protein